MIQYILRENVLTDNVLTIHEDSNYVAILEEYIFQNSWSDKKIVKKFRSKKSLTNYLEKNYSSEEIENVEL